VKIGQTPKLKLTTISALWRQNWTHFTRGANSCQELFIVLRYLFVVL
jgi:hypothetical protein